MKITKSQLKQVIKEEIEALMKEVHDDDDDGDDKDKDKDASGEEDFQGAHQGSKLEEEKDDEFLQDVKSTGEWTDYTIGQLKKKKDVLMKKKKRTADEVTTVRQLNFAINAKQGDYEKK